MKNLDNYNGRLSKYDESEQIEILNLFVNSIILDLNVKLTGEEIKHIKNRIHEKKGNSILIGQLREIHYEIISNYKKYLPFCYASIETAARNKNNG